MPRTMRPEWPRHRKLAEGVGLLRLASRERNHGILDGSSMDTRSSVWLAPLTFLTYEVMGLGASSRAPGPSQA
jgi:hypothetical protein